MARMNTSECNENDAHNARIKRQKRANEKEWPLSSTEYREYNIVFHVYSDERHEKNTVSIMIVISWLLNWLLICSLVTNSAPWRVIIWQIAV